MTKPILLALFVSLALNGLFGYLSYSFYSDKAVAESQLEVVVKSNKDLKESLDKKDAVCTLQDKIAAENQVEQQEIVKEKDADLDAITKMVSTSAPKQKAVKGAENADEKDNEASLDSVLPSALIRVLNESCHRSKGSSCTNP